MRKTPASEPYVLSPEELRALQMVLLDMLIELDRICKKNNIKYTIVAGTLLGAVRHGGFIPWDDDLDVAMLREEYIKFREACKQDLNEDKYFFQDNTTDPYYRWGYARIRRKNSEFVRVGQEHMKMKTGIFLDVFPVDNMPSSPVLRTLHNFYCFVLRKLLYAETGMVTGKNTFMRGWYKLLNFVPASFTFKRVDKMANYWNKRPAKEVRTLMFPITKSNKYESLKKWCVELTNVEFEGHIVPAAKDYHEYLEFKFGNYMELPPPEARHWHPVVKFKLPED